MELSKTFVNLHGKLSEQDNGWQEQKWEDNESARMKKKHAARNLVCKICTKEMIIIWLFT